MTNIPYYVIGEVMDISVNGKPAKAYFVGYEWAWWAKPADWLWHLRIDAYPFDIQVKQADLREGIDIRTNGNTVKVSSNAKVEAK
jgi:hypothetical protein